MIPKIIHYCWFGKSPLPKLAKECIQSWKKYCPDFVIKEWNETNSPIHLFPFAEQVLEAKNGLSYQILFDYTHSIRKVAYIWIQM